jgi:hypothetical protein
VGLYLHSPIHCHGVLRNSVACIFSDVINISSLFHISELLFVEVVKITHRARTNRFLVQKFVPKTPVQSVPLWDTADSAGGTQGVWFVCLFSLRAVLGAVRCMWTDVVC